jgi:hypothetical protein
VTSGMFGERLSRDLSPELRDKDRGSKVREEWLESGERRRTPYSHSRPEDVHFLHCG